MTLILHRLMLGKFQKLSCVKLANFWLESLPCVPLPSLSNVNFRAATSIRVLGYTQIRSKESSTNGRQFRNRWIAIFVRNGETILLLKFSDKNNQNNDLKEQFTLEFMVIDYKTTYPGPEVDKLIFE